VNKNRYGSKVLQEHSSLVRSTGTKTVPIISCQPLAAGVLLLAIEADELAISSAVF